MTDLLANVCSQPPVNPPEKGVCLKNRHFFTIKSLLKNEGRLSTKQGGRLVLSIWRKTNQPKMGCLGGLSLAKYLISFINSYIRQPRQPFIN